MAHLIGSFMMIALILAGLLGTVHTLFDTWKDRLLAVTIFVLIVSYVALATHLMNAP